ncbi:hypothetical protein PVAR5_5210 [Paecilomyces variotii No. 5]|uniref:Uncharacterized protein n=1 Tax=Byssochlamys spectabilis (strain No. 5 / NBRC 109023) TaxID=1356009 RepID=V5G6R6_BYSSN|nr:hypothetical protein PVAR5_5210 [Paecilomyces variotii No. 5]
MPVSIDGAGIRLQVATARRDELFHQQPPRGDIRWTGTEFSTTADVRLPESETGPVGGAKRGVDDGEQPKGRPAVLGGRARCFQALSEWLLLNYDDDTLKFVGGFTSALRSGIVTVTGASAWLGASWTTATAEASLATELASWSSRTYGEDEWLLSRWLTITRQASFYSGRP